LFAAFAAVFVSGWLVSTMGHVPVRAGDPAPQAPDSIADSVRKLREAAELARCQVVSGPIAQVPHPASKALYPVDAVYYLDYRGARLLAAVPNTGSTLSDAPSSSERLTTEFVERDLAADFQIPPGVEPSFQMTVARMGFANGGWAPLYVFESATNQMACYRVKPEMAGTTNRTQIVLLERKTLGKSGLPSLSR
jgi:hypothetical protein